MKLTSLGHRQAHRQVGGLDRGKAGSANASLQLTSNLDLGGLTADGPLAPPRPQHGRQMVGRSGLAYAGDAGYCQLSQSLVHYIGHRDAVEQMLVS